MEKREYRPRYIDKKIEDYLEAFGAVCIEGPKWCGKTMSAEQHAQSVIYLGDPAKNFQNRKLAELSPNAVLKGETPRLIDEWQEVPPLWDAVRFQVDQRNGQGQFILTGSATPNHKGILHSGAGRIARLQMDTMTLFELGESSGEVSLQNICEGQTEDILGEDIQLMRLATLIARGGWPGSIGLKDERAMLLPHQYLEAVLNDDIYRLDDIKRDPHKIRLLLKSLARNESTTAANRVLLRDIKTVDDEDLDPETIATYLDVLKRLFLIDNTPPFHSNIRSSVRVKQAEKRHFVDCSLPCSILGLSPEGLIRNLETFGFLFEALCEHDLKIYAQSFGGKLFHYQDYKNREIDAVIELRNKDWCAFEIKLGANQIDVAAENLKNISDSIAKEGGKAPKTLCVVCGLSRSAYRREDGVYVVPLTMLRE